MNTSKHKNSFYGKIILWNCKIWNRIQIESQKFQLLAKVTTLIITDNISQPIKQNTQKV